METHNNPSTNPQDPSHNEGQQQNASPQLMGTEQSESEDNTEKTRDIISGSDKQRAGGADEQRGDDRQGHQP